MGSRCRVKRGWFYWKDPAKGTNSKWACWPCEREPRPYCEPFSIIAKTTSSYGIEKSAVSDRFVRVSREKLRELLERPLDQLKLCVIYLDGIEFKGQHLVVALGVAVDGAKTVLGLRQGASENATVVGELLDDLVAKPVDLLPCPAPRRSKRKSWLVTKSVK